MVPLGQCTEYWILRDTPNDEKRIDNKKEEYQNWECYKFNENAYGLRVVCLWLSNLQACMYYVWGMGDG